jgi:RecB family exonuclease
MRIERERQLFWDSCDAARRRLVLAWSRLDPTTGATRLPSTLLLDFAVERTGRAVDYERFLALPFVERVPLRRTRLDPAMPALHRAEIETWIASSLPGVAARAWVSRLDTPAARGVGLERRRNAARFTDADGMLEGAAARAALGARMHGASFSATQLTNYATCPFRYFWRYLLRVEPLEREDRRDLSQLESGRLAHEVLERLHAGAQRAGRALADMDDDELDAALDAALGAACAEIESGGRPTAPLLWDVRRRRLRDDLARFVRLERADAGAWRPAAFEQRFGRDAALVPALATPDGRRLRLHGVIDRIDTQPGTDAVRVVDYKTGRAITAKSRDPRAAQLVLYLFAASGGDRERWRKSEARFVHVTRRGDFAVQGLHGSDDLWTDLEVFAAGVVGGITRGELFPQPGPGAQHCATCDYQGACEARVGPLAVRKSAAGQTQAFAALPDFVSALAGHAGEAGDGEEVEG